jgi:hypothetical protein
VNGTFSQNTANTGAVVAVTAISNNAQSFLAVRNGFSKIDVSREF